MSPEAFTLDLPPMTLDVAGKGALISLVALGVAAGLRRAAAAGRHLVLALATAALLVLPALAAILPAREVAILPATAAEPFVASGPMNLRPGSPVWDEEAKRAAWASSSPTGRGDRGKGPTALLAAAVFPVLVPVLVLSVSTLLLARLLVALRQLARLSSASCSAPREWLEILDEQRRRLGIAQPVRLGLSSAVAVPITFGWRRPAVLLPEAARGWEDSQLREVLVHELAHVRRRDWPVQMAARVACALHWFDPLVWLLCRRLLLEAELACDDQVLRAGVGATEYAQRLVSIARKTRGASRRPAMAVAFARPSGLANRVASILDPRRRRGGPGRLVAVGAAAAALILVGLVAPARLVQAEPRSPNPRFTATSSFPLQALPPLHRAAWQGDEIEVQRLLAGGADPDQPVPRLGTPLILAAAQGHEDVVAVLLAAGADPARVETGPERPGNLQRSPLGAAAAKGDLEVVRKLLAAGAPVDLAPRGDATPLMNAAENGHRDVVEELLGAGADPNAVVLGDGTPLIAAARGDEPAIVRRLLTAGAKPDVYVPGDETALQQAIEHGHAEVVRLLLEAGAAPVAISSADDLDEAVREGAREGVREAAEDLRQGRDESWIESIVDGVEEGKRESLIEAAARGDHEAVHHLLRVGADPDGAVLGDGTPLIAAAREGREEIVQLLLGVGANPDAVLPGDGSPLIAAAREGHKRIVRLLLDAGAAVDRVVPGDENPLIHAAWHGRLEVVRMLLDAGADPNVRVVANRSLFDPDGELRTPLRMARRGGHGTVERLLRERGAKD